MEHFFSDLHFCFLRNPFHFMRFTIQVLTRRHDVVIYFFGAKLWFRVLNSAIDNGVDIDR